MKDGWKLVKIRAGQQHWLMCHRAVMQIWVNKVQTVWGFNLHFNNHFIWSNPIQHLSNRCWSLGSPVPPLSLSLCNLSQKVMCCSAPLTYSPPPLWLKSSPCYLQRVACQSHTVFYRSVSICCTIWKMWQKKPEKQTKRPRSSFTELWLIPNGREQLEAF